MTVLRRSTPGDVARRMVAGVRTAGSDQPICNSTVSSSVPGRCPPRGHRVVSHASLPSSGGLVLTQILNMLEMHPLMG